MATKFRHFEAQENRGMPDGYPALRGMELELPRPNGAVRLATLATADRRYVLPDRNLTIAAAEDVGDPTMVGASSLTAAVADLQARLSALENAPATPAGGVLSYVEFSRARGWGSTAIKIPVFEDMVSVGPAFQATNSPVQGARITVLQAGFLYAGAVVAYNANCATSIAHNGPTPGDSTIEHGFATWEAARVTVQANATGLGISGATLGRIIRVQAGDVLYLNGPGSNQTPQDFWRFYVYGLGI